MHLLLVECCFMYPETIAIGLLGTGAQDGHLNFHAAPEFNFCTFDDLISLYIFCEHFKTLHNTGMDKFTFKFTPQVTLCRKPTHQSYAS